MQKIQQLDEVLDWLLRYRGQLVEQHQTPGIEGHDGASRRAASSDAEEPAAACITDLHEFVARLPDPDVWQQVLPPTSGANRGASVSPSPPRMSPVQPRATPAAAGRVAEPQPPAASGQQQPVGATRSGAAAEGAAARQTGGAGAPAAGSTPPAAMSDSLDLQQQQQALDSPEESAAPLSQETPAAAAAAAAGGPAQQPRQQAGPAPTSAAVASGGEQHQDVEMTAVSSDVEMAGAEPDPSQGVPGGASPVVAFWRRPGAPCILAGPVFEAQQHPVLPQAPSSRHTQQAAGSHAHRLHHPSCGADPHVEFCALQALRVASSPSAICRGSWGWTPSAATQRGEFPRYCCRTRCWGYVVGPAPALGGWSACRQLLAQPPNHQQATQWGGLSDPPHHASTPTDLCSCALSELAVSQPAQQLCLHGCMAEHVDVL